MRFASCLAAVLSLSSPQVQARRTNALQLHARLAEVHQFDCTTANTDQCETKCTQSVHCATDMTDRPQYRQCFVDLGAECGVMAQLYRRTNRTSTILWDESKSQGPLIFVRSAVADTYEGSLPITSNTAWDHSVRLWLPQASLCDGLTVNIWGGSVSSASKTAQVVASAITDDVLQIPTTDVWSASAYGAGVLASDLLPCLPNPEEYATDNTTRVEQWYFSKGLYRMWGVDSLNHLSLYEA